MNGEYQSAPKALNEEHRFFEVELPSFNMLRIEQLMKLPPPAWLIEGLIEESVFGVLYGPSGEGKSFVALDWALSVASSEKWQERCVVGGAVVYVVAEGGRNIWKRIKAWMDEHSVKDVPGLFIILDSVQFTNDSHVRGLLLQIQKAGINPRLIIIDTLARCFDGDENSSQDMGRFVKACATVQRSLTATVLAVHHTGKKANSKSGERGSSALRGAADVMISVSKRGDIVQINVDKQKDDEPITGIRLRLLQVVVGVDEITGKNVTSCVLATAGKVPPEMPMLPVGPLRALQTLVYEFGGVADSGTWRKAIVAPNGLAMPEKTFHTHKKQLLQGGLITEIDRGSWYAATDEGTATAKKVPFNSQRQLPNTSAASATPPMGVAGGTGVAESASVTREVSVTAAEGILVEAEGESVNAAR